MIKLSILIPTVYGREWRLDTLVAEFKRQYAFRESSSTIFPKRVKAGTPAYVIDEHVGAEVEIIICKDDKSMTIGDKRERLYRMAKGLYSVQWDDDDSIHSSGLRLILQCISYDKDCITYQERCTINGQNFTCNHSLKYEDWIDGFDGYDFVRTPYMKDVIRTEIACSVPIPHIRYGEDHAWSRDLRPHLKSEVHISTPIYHYQHESTDFNERYGLDKK